MAGKPKHGDAQNGKATRLYNIWRGMRQRCTNPKATGYHDYGGRGISVDPSWGSYSNFRSWAIKTGYLDSLSIERRNVDGNYCPDNCYWADNTIQACNKRKRKGNKSQYIGVSLNKRKWQAYVNYQGKWHGLGVYESEKEAALARDNFVRQNNFPHKLNF